ncbi:MAG: hypothetical protein HeimC2_12950 [Candidatus Heimdallarchaeota archaeon LC_2]|nr:MAG: hypothetical protein HeimC2_12950 [Candidatus Heimdallarchaeota archaeon LC_2]
MIRNTNLSSLKYKRVIDSDGNDIGTIKDAVINMNSLELRGFVIHGSRLEELMETLKLRADVDPLLSNDFIENFDTNQITLNVNKEKLSNAMAQGEIKEDEILFSQLRKIPVFSKQNRKVGIFSDIFFDSQGLSSYSLGGQVFQKILCDNNCSKTLNYVVNSSLLTKTNAGYEINRDIHDLEKHMKLNLTNAVRDILIESEKDGIITEDEKNLISAVKIDVINYQHAINLAQEDNIITKEEQMVLDSIKTQILENVISVAKKDDNITDEEILLIRKLASYMSNRKEELFWNIFGP